MPILTSIDCNCQEGITQGMVLYKVTVCYCQISKYWIELIVPQTVDHIKHGLHHLEGNVIENWFSLNWHSMKCGILLTDIQTCKIRTVAKSKTAVQKQSISW